jgi:hypothetical protein
MRPFVGLEVALEKTAVCVLNEHERIVKKADVASEPEGFARWIATRPGGIAAVGLEAGPPSQWLHRGLSTAGLDVVPMETRPVKGALKAMPIKTGRRDAEGIARLARISGGSGRFTASPSRLGKSAPCSGRARRSSRGCSRWRCRRAACRGTSVSRSAPSPAGGSNTASGNGWQAPGGRKWPPSRCFVPVPPCATNRPGSSGTFAGRPRTTRCAGA